MLERKINSTAATVISRIIGDAAFMFTDPLDAEGRPPVEGWTTLGVSLSFSGDIAGEFRFWASPSLTQGIAVNMLGLDQAAMLSDEKLKDALKEIVNIIVGNFITEMYGDGVVATLGLPGMIEPAHLGGDHGNPDAQWLSVDGNPVLCVMRIDKGPSMPDAPAGDRP
jgi:hypothetical protein